MGKTIIAPFLRESPLWPDNLGNLRLAERSYSPVGFCFIASIDSQNSVCAERRVLEAKVVDNPISSSGQFSRCTTKSRKNYHET